MSPGSEEGAHATEDGLYSALFVELSDRKECVGTGGAVSDVWDDHPLEATLRCSRYEDEVANLGTLMRFLIYADDPVGARAKIGQV